MIRLFYVTKILYLVNPSSEELFEKFNVTNNRLQVKQKVEAFLVWNVAE